MSKREEKLPVNATARKIIAFVVGTILVLGMTVAGLSHETFTPTNPAAQSGSRIAH